MPANYVLLERIELNASAASVTFANIPQSGYTDLKVVFSGRIITSGPDSNPWTATGVQLNSTNSSSQKQLFGTGSATGSDSNTSPIFVTDTNATASTYSSGEIYIPNYLSSNQKSVSIDVVTENNATAAVTIFWAGLYNVTAAVSSVTFTGSTYTFDANSTFSLYGLAAVGTTPVIAPKASGGNIIDFDGTYWIHTFTSTGAFVPQQGLTCDYLVVAGGGAGENTAGGGGGAGGLRSTVTATGGGGSLESPLAVIAQSYTITVGAGGASGTSSPVASGNNSVFSTITSTGGGAGGQYRFNSGIAGGSGGGSGGGDDAGTPGGQTGGAGTANQGFAGGNSTSNANRGGGGGGGAGAAGSVGGAPAGGAGGNGVATSISGSSVTYAGGGGGVGCATAFGGPSSPGGAGGAGGTGGGGTGGFGTTNAGLTSGTTNRGGGGGGGGYSGSVLTGGNGGSGIVIIRYLA
jgi:hypothetical protein